VSMTVGRMHRILSRLMHEGNSRRRVYIDKDSFRHPCEGDGIVILPVESIKLRWFPVGDDDGGIKILKDGTESISAGIVMGGGYEVER